MANTKIPTQVIDFSVYNGENKLMGAGAEITLPTITSKTYTADLPAGEIDLPGMRTENMEIEIPFNVFDKEAASILSVANATTIVLRGCLQSSETNSHDLSYSGVKVTIKGFTKEVSIGTLKRSDGMDSKVKLTVSYIKVEDGNNNIFIEVDKFNGTYTVNGEDVREGISNYL